MSLEFLKWQEFIETGGDCGCINIVIRYAERVTWCANNYRGNCRQ
jgi:hypothetical protein